jgi:hypothetical protein
MSGIQTNFRAADMIGAAKPVAVPTKPVKPAKPAKVEEPVVVEAAVEAVTEDAAPEADAE